MKRTKDSIRGTTFFLRRNTPAPELSTTITAFNRLLLLLFIETALQATFHCLYLENLSANDFPLLK